MPMPDDRYMQEHEEQGEEWLEHPAGRKAWLKRNTNNIIKKMRRENDILNENNNNNNMMFLIILATLGYFIL